MIHCESKPNAIKGERNGGDVLSQPRGGPPPPYPGMYVSIGACPISGLRTCAISLKKIPKKMPQKNSLLLSRGGVFFLKLFTI